MSTSGRAERDLAAVEAEHAVEAARLLDVVRRDEHAAALGGEAVDERGEHVGARRVDARERLVEQHERGVLHERARHQHALALAARELAERALGELLETHLGERGERAPALAPPGRRHQGSRETEPIRATSSAVTG